MALISLQSRRGTIQLLEHSQFLKAVSGEAGVVNLCIVSPVDGVCFSVNENADPDVRIDHLAAIPRLHPPPGSAQALLFRKSLTLPYFKNVLCLGTWQGIYLIDLREESADPVQIMVTCRHSIRRQTFSVNAVARDATQLEAEISKQLPACDGCIFVHEMHTSASLSLGSGNLEPILNRVVPEQWHYEFFQHTMEGVDDMTGHLKCSLLGCSATVPVLENKPLVPVRLNEHRYAGGFGGGHTRKLLLDHLPPATKAAAFDVSLDGTSELSAELAKREIDADLINFVVVRGSGGLLVGSRQAVDNFKAPDESILAQFIDLPKAALSAGVPLWWLGGPATLRITPI